MAGVSSATRAKLRDLIAHIHPMADEPKKKLERLLASGPAALQVAKARACIELASDADEDARRAVGFLAGPVLARALAPGETLDPTIDAFISLIGTTENVRTMLGRIPAERRVAIWQRELAWAREETNREWKRYLVERAAMTMLDIAPELAPFIEAFRGELPAKPREPLGRRPFPPKKPDAPYVFADPFVVNAADWDDLGDTLRMQLIKAVERMMGKKVRSARGVARALDDAPDEFEIRTWDVYDAKATEKDAPVFNCWVFRVDNAVFFRHDTLDRVPVYVLQDSFMNDDGGTASAELAVALEASAPESLWAT